MTSTRIVPATQEADFKLARVLFEEYAAHIGVDLCFQGFSDELDHLQDIYAPPGGCLLLAYTGGQPAGCVALRTKAEGVCEMKRLFVRPAFRSAGAGRLLAMEVVRCARARGYQRMVLDTLDQMKAARGLYASLGFQEVGAYYDNPLAGVHYMALDLTPSNV